MSGSNFTALLSNVYSNQQSDKDILHFNNSLLSILAMHPQILSRKTWLVSLPFTSVNNLVWVKDLSCNPECFIIAEGNNSGDNWAIPSRLKMPIIAHWSQVWGDLGPGFNSGSPPKLLARQRRAGVYHSGFFTADFFLLSSISNI